MATRADFPDEILVEIFSRLPAKPIGKFRSLSKSWRKSLSSPHFIKSHLARQKSRFQQQENLILITTLPRPFRCIETINDDDGTVSRALDLPAGLHSNVLIPCDGLILLIIDWDQMFLANPITQEQVRLPSSPLGCDDKILNFSFTALLYGLVHDSVNDDYKVVKVFFMNDFSRIFGIYSVKTGVCKTIKSPPVINTYPPKCRSAASFNGAIHWLAGGYTHVGDIRAFDVANEVCFEIPVPSDIHASSVLRVLGGCLCIIDEPINGEWTDVWIMKEYGMADSWTKFIVPKTVYDPCCAPLKPLCYIRDEEEVVLVENEQLVVHNVKEGTSRDLVVDGTAGTVLDGYAFVDSLVSPTALWGHGGEQGND